MTFDFGEYAVQHPDDACWMVSRRRAQAGPRPKPGARQWRPVSYHGTLEDALENVIRLMADDRGAATLAKHVENIRGVWADVKRMVWAERRRSEGQPPHRREGVK